MGQHSATQYLRDLNGLYGSIEVGNGRGRRLTLDTGIERAVNLLRDLAPVRKKAILVGNGGSAAIASHMQTDLSNGAGVRALVFNDAPMVTATSNDFGYGSVFEKPSQLWMEDGDLMIAISSSGRSDNILRAAQICLSADCHLITFSGFSPDNALRRRGHINFYVPSDSYGYVEVVHGALAHIMTDFLIRDSRDRVLEPAVWSLHKVN